MKIQNKNTYILILYLSVVTSVLTAMLALSSYELSFAQKDDNNDDEDQEDNRLIVKAKINLKNIDMEKTKYIRIIGL